MTKDHIILKIISACDSFKGIDRPVYRDYVLAIIFFKYISDEWLEKKGWYERKYQGMSEAVSRAMGNEPLHLSDNLTFDYLYMHRNDKNPKSLIHYIFYQLEKANPEILEDVLSHIAFNLDSLVGEDKAHKMLIDFLEKIHYIDLRPNTLGDIRIGDIFELLIAYFAENAGKREEMFYTPQTVSSLMAGLAIPQTGDQIYDPASGSGSLLLKIGEQIGHDHFKLYGQELSKTIWAISKMNMLLHHQNKALIQSGDTLENPLFVEEYHLQRFDIVISNPPFSISNWGFENADRDPYRRFFRGIPPKSKGDYAFIQHMIESAYPNVGRVITVVSHGVLFREGSEKMIRKALIQDNLLEAVIGLPPNLFYGTTISVAILIFHKGKKDNQDVLFIDASSDFESGKSKNKLSFESIHKIIETYKLFRETISLKEGPGKVIEEKYAYRATLTDIIENDFNLNISRYIDHIPTSEKVCIPEIQQRIKALQSDLKKVQEKIDESVKNLGF